MTEPETNRICQRLVALTRDLILIPSIPTRPEDRRRCFEFVKNHLDTLEHVRVQEFTQHHIPSLIALPKDCHRPEVLMCAHLDVITHPDIAFYRSEIRDGRIIGPGAGDMKGALAVLMEVFRDVHLRHPGASLGLAVTSDEETGGLCGLAHLFRQCGLRCGTAMIPDGGSLNDITVDEKGILHLRVQCRGRPAHAARPWLGDNPIQRLMDALERVRALFQTWHAPEGDWYPTCAVTVIGTENQTVNRIPADAHAVLDIRFPTPHTADAILRTVRQRLDDQVQTDVIISAEPAHLSPDPLYRQVIEQITGQPANLVRDCGGSDARFVCPYGIPVLMSRPLVGNLHADDEWVEIDSLTQFYRIYRTYLARKLGLPDSAGPAGE